MRWWNLITWRTAAPIWAAWRTSTDIAAVALQSPNFFGVIEDLEAAATAIHDAGALFVTCFTEPLAYGLLKNPGQCGADIVCGEGQSFGIARSFGGPGLGMFGCREPFTRNLPGRLVGETKDIDGRRGYVLTLATREQHIRREKATSNICSNQGICAMTAGMYMASLGGTGIRQLARLNYDKAQYLKDSSGARPGPGCSSPARCLMNSWSNFPRISDLPTNGCWRRISSPGWNWAPSIPELAGRSLFCVTETISKQTMDTIVAEVRA